MITSTVTQLDLDKYTLAAMQGLCANPNIVGRYSDDVQVKLVANAATKIAIETIKTRDALGEKMWAKKEG